MGGILLSFNLFGVIFSYNDLNFFHDYNCFLLVFVLVFIIFIYLFLGVASFGCNLSLSHKRVELNCCGFPFLILIIQLIPRLLLFFDIIFFFEDYFLRLKIIGHQ